MDNFFTIIIFGSAILLPPILCFIIAGVDNRNQTRWFLYGLLFGIFAVIYLVFYTKKGDSDKIRPRVMVLLGILVFFMLFSLYETFFGLLANQFVK